MKTRRGRMKSWRRRFFFLKEKYEAVVEKNTMLEEQIHGCTVHLFPVSQAAAGQVLCTGFFFHVRENWDIGEQFCPLNHQPQNWNRGCSDSFSPSTAANLLYCLSVISSDQADEAEFTLFGSLAEQVK